MRGEIKLNSKKQKVVIILFLLLIGIFSVSSSIDIGDESEECEDGEIPKVSNGVWECSILDTNNQSNSDSQDKTYILYIDSSKFHQVVLNLSDSEDSLYVLNAQIGEDWIYGKFQ